ncbi:MAG: hypothetical protein K2N55_07930, partial [Lachnospiraceae bacterium]|nr:hypothetical protein [Lachnospiraceae bacterium]
MNELKKEMIKGILFVSIVGTLCHFIYKWSGKNPIAGLFFPVNESTWEHMKLLFFPMLLYALYMYKKQRMPRYASHPYVKLKDAYPCILSALLYGILTGTFLIPVLFYTYKGILGRDYIALDIAVFLGSVILAFWTVYKFTLSCKSNALLPLLKAAVFALAVCFLVFTYYPPAIG